MTSQAEGVKNMKTWAAVIICLFLFPWSVQSAEFYRWTDENGVSHVTDQPPTETGKKVKTYRFQQPTKPVFPESQTPGEGPGVAVEGQSEGGQPAEDQQEQDSDRNKELEKARQEYEEAKSHETEYRRNFNDSYGYGKERNSWREKLEDIENKRQKLENLESGGSVGEETSTPHPQGDQTPR
jgi:hypothetical protein